MAWIESHQALKDHPKVSRLASEMRWDADLTIGKLHRFWWWCLDYAPDGDLRKFNDAQIAAAMCVDMAQAENLKQALIVSCWIDREPYFRVHDWWDYAGRFLKLKFKDKPNRWESIKSAYSSVTVSVTPPLKDSVTIPLTHLTDQPTNHTDQPNIHIAPALPASEQEAADWASMENIPADFAKDVYNQCVGVNWKDGANRDITNWRSYIKQRYSKRQEFKSKEMGKSETTWEMTQKIEAKKKLLQTIKNRGHEDPFGSITYANDKDRQEAQKLKAEIKELERKLAS